MANVQMGGPPAPLPEGHLPKRIPFTRQKEASHQALAALAIANVRMITPKPELEQRSSLWQKLKDFITPGVGYYATVGNLQKLVLLAKTGKITAKNIHKLSKEQLAHLKGQLNASEVATLKRAAETNIASRAELQAALIHFTHDASYEQAALSYANNTLKAALLELNAGKGLSNATKEHVAHLQTALQGMDFAKRMEFFGKLTLPNLTNDKLGQLFGNHSLNTELCLAQHLMGSPIVVDEATRSYLEKELNQLQPLARIELMAQWKIPTDSSIKRMLTVITHTVNHRIVYDWDVACLISNKIAVDNNRLDLHTLLQSLEPIQRISFMMQWNLAADSPVLQAVEGNAADIAVVKELQNDARKAHNFNVLREELQSGESLQNIVTKYSATLLKYLPENNNQLASFIEKWKREMKGTGLEHLFTHLLIARHEMILDSFSDAELAHVKSYLQEMDFTSRLNWMSSWKSLASPQVAASRVDDILTKMGNARDFRLAQALAKRSKPTESERAHLRNELTKLDPPTELQRQQLRTLHLSENAQLTSDPVVAALIFKVRVESFLTSKDPHVQCDITPTEYTQLLQSLQTMEPHAAVKYVNKWTVNFNDKTVRDVLLLLAKEVPAVKNFIFEKRIDSYLQSPQGKDPLNDQELDFLKVHLDSIQENERTAYLLRWNIDTNQSAQVNFLQRLGIRTVITSDECDAIYLRNFHAGRSSVLVPAAAEQLRQMLPAAVLQKASQWNIEDQARVTQHVVLSLASLKAHLQDLLTTTQIIAYQIAKGRPVDTTFSAQNASDLVTCLLAMPSDRRLEYLKKCEFSSALCKQLLTDNPSLYYDYMRIKGLPITDTFPLAAAPTLKQYLERLDPSVRREYLALCTLSHNMFQYKYLEDALTLDYMIAKKLSIDHNSPVGPAILKKHLESLPEVVRSDYIKICDFTERQLLALGIELTVAYQVAKGIPIDVASLNPADFKVLKNHLLTKSSEERQAYFEKCDIIDDSILLRDPQLKESAMRARINGLLKGEKDCHLSLEEQQLLNADLSALTVEQRAKLLKSWIAMTLFSCMLQQKFQRELVMIKRLDLSAALLPKASELQEFAECLQHIATLEKQKEYVNLFCQSLTPEQKKTLLNDWNVNILTTAGKLLLSLLPQELDQEKYTYFIKNELLPPQELMDNFVGHLSQYNTQATKNSVYVPAVKNMARELQRLPYQVRIDYLRTLDLRTPATKNFLNELWNHSPELVALYCLAKRMSLEEMKTFVAKDDKAVADAVFNLLYTMIGRDVSPDERLALLQQIHIDKTVHQALHEQGKDLGEFRKFQMILVQHRTEGVDVIVPLLLAVTPNNKIVVRELRTLGQHYKNQENIALVDAILRHPQLQ